MPRNKRLTKSIRKPSSRTAKTWNGHPPISRNSRLRLQNGKPATSAACNWSDFDSAKMATSWSCKSPFSSTENRPTEPLKSIVGTRRNTTECRERPAISRTTFENHGNSQRAKEKRAKENQHKVQVERRINLANIGKQQRPGKKYPRALEQPPPEHDLGSGRSQAA